MIAKLRHNRPGIIGHFLKMIGLIVGKPSPVLPGPQDEPAGYVGLLRPVRLEVDQCCLVAMATAVGIASHEGMLSTRAVNCLAHMMEMVAAGVDRPAQEAMAAGNARGRRLAAEHVTARLFSAAHASVGRN